MSFIDQEYSGLAEYVGMGAGVDIRLEGRSLVPLLNERVRLFCRSLLLQGDVRYEVLMSLQDTGRIDAPSNAFKSFFDEPIILFGVKYKEYSAIILTAAKYMQNRMQNTLNAIMLCYSTCCGDFLNKIY